MSDVKQEIIDIVGEHLDYNKSKIKMKSDIVNDLGADSLDCIEIVMALEKKYDISISDEDADNVRTIEQLIKIVEEKKKWLKL